MFSVGSMTYVGSLASDPVLARLYPDADKLALEEQRRFELIEAHWDTPLEEHALPR